MSLTTIYNTFLAQMGGTGGTNPITIDDASLGSTGVNALIQSSLGLQNIQVTVSTMNPPTTQLVVVGTSSFLLGASQNGLMNGANLSVTVTITDNGSSEVDLDIVVTLPSGWTLGKSFYAWAGTAFDSTSVISSPQIIFTNYEHSSGTTPAVDLSPGLNFAVVLGLSASGPLSLVLRLLDVAPPQLLLEGLLTLTTAGPTFVIAGGLPDVKAPIGPISITQCAFQLSLEWVPDTETDTPFLPLIGSRFTGKTTIVANHPPTTVMAEVVPGHDTLTLQFTGDPSTGIVNTSDLSALLASFTGYSGTVPWNVLGNPPIGLMELGVMTQPAKITSGTFPPATLWATVATLQPWTIIPNVKDFVIQQLAIKWTIVGTPGKGFAGTFATVEAKLAIKSYTFDVQVSLPDLTVGGQMIGGVSLNLSDISANFFSGNIPPNPDLSQTSLAFYDFSTVVAPKTKSFSLACTATINVAFAGIDIELEAASLALSTSFATSPIQYSFTIAGLLSVQQWPFNVSAEIANAGLKFSGNLTQPRTLSVSDVLGRLLSGIGIAPPNFDLSATIKKFGFAMDTGAKTYQVQGDVAWTIGLLGKTFTPDTTFSVLSATDRSGARSWTGYLGASIPIGSMTFAVKYQFGPQMSTLVGTLTSGTYDPTSFGSNFNASLPAMPPANLPTFNMTGIALMYDFMASDLVLLGQVPVGGGGNSLAGFLEIRRGGGVSGFTFGIGMQSAGNFFSNISSFLAPIDSLGLTGLSLVLSNLPVGSAYKIPIPGFVGYNGVYPGVNVYATFQWDTTSNKGLQFARSALSPNATTLSVLAAYYLINGGQTFVLAGRLQNLSLDFSKWNIVVNWAEMRLSIESGEAGESIGVQFLVQLTYTPGTGTYIPYKGAAPQPAQLIFTGMLAFVEANGNFGAFMGASMIGTWQDALGFTGLNLSNLGLVVGISTEPPPAPPLPSFGLSAMVAYHSFFGWITIFFDSVNPAQSMFGGAFSPLMLGDMLQFCLPVVNVPSSLMDALNEFGLTHTTPQPVTGLTADDFTELNDGNVSDNVRQKLSALGFQLAAQSGSMRTVVVSSFTDGSTGNPAWYIANTPNMLTLTFVADGPITTATSAQVSLNVQIYVAPTTVTPFPGMTFQQGYRFDGTLEILGWTLEVQAFVNPSQGVYLGAYASPIMIPSSGSLLSITAADDTTKGPWLSLSTFDYSDPKFPYGTGPHFGLSAEIDLLSYARSKLLVLILKTGLTFEYSISLGDPNGSFIGATIDCTYGNSLLIADAAFIAQLYLHIPGVSVGGVQIIPEISAKIFSVSAAIGLNISGSQCVVAAAVSLDVFGMGFSVSFSFNLPGMGQLISNLASGILSNLPQLFAPLLKDVIAWARAMATGAIHALEDLGKTIYYFFSGDFQSAAQMLGQLGQDVEQIQNLLSAMWSLPATIILNVITKVFQLQFQYFGVGQHIGPAQLGSAPVSGLVDWMKNTASPAFAAGNYSSLVSATGGAMGVFDARLVQIVRISAALFDPGLYGMEISLNIDDTNLLTIPLGYQKLTDTQGVFTASLAPPPQWKTRSFGPFGFQIPSIDLSVFTTGDWVVNVGFPFNNDWSRAAKLEMPFFSGQGGFYLGRPPAGTVSPFPSQQVTAVLGMGIAARMSIGGSINVGILSGGIQVTFTGIVQGCVGFGQGIDSSSGNKSMFANPAAIMLEGAFNLSGLLYGSVDFGIVSASVHIAISASLMIAVKNGMPTDFSFNVSVSVSVSITIDLFLCSITISFSFDTTIHYGPVINWGGSSLRMAAVVEEVAPLSWTPLSEHRMLMMGMTANAPLPLWLAPEVTLVFPASGPGVPNGVANLAIGYTANTPSSPFNQLVQALIVWATQNDGGPAPTPGTITLDELNYLVAQLNAKGTLTRATAGVGGTDPSSILDYEKLVTFLSTTFTVSVSPAPNDQNSPAQGVFFPMIPDLTLWASGQTGTSKPVQIADFSQVNLRDSNYVKMVMQLLAAMRVMGGGDGGVVVVPMSPISAATLIFEEYFAMLIKGGAQALIDFMNSSSTTSMTAAQLAAFDFKQLAGSVATAFRGGLQLPYDTTNSSPTPLMVLTGQQFPLNAPSTGTYTVSVEPGTNGGWLTVSPTGVALDLTQLATYSKLSVDPLFAQGIGQAPALSSQPATFVFPTSGWQNWAQTTGAPWLMTALPASLEASASVGGVSVSMDSVPAGTPPNAGDPLTIPFAWATALTLVVQRVPDASSPTGFSRNVYQLVGSDPRQFAAIDGLTAWLAQGGGVTATPTLLYVDPSTGSQTTPAAPAASIGLLRTNTTTESRPPALRVTMAKRAVASTDIPLSASFTATDAVSLMSIIKEYGIVNSSGYYLAVPGASGQPGLPDALFGTGQTATLTVLLTRGPTPSATASMVLPSDTTFVLQGQSPSGQQIAAVGTSTLVYHSLQQPGTLAVAFTRANPGSGSLQASLDTLYNLFTAQITGANGYTASPFASPAGPQRPTGSNPATTPWNYLLAVPTARFLPAGSLNPYAVAGTTPQLAFQIRDSFGNVDTPASTSQTFSILYTDPITPFGGWRGTQLGWTVGATAETLTITLSADQTQLESLSPQDISNLLTVWQTIAWQTSDPNITFDVGSTLDTRQMVTVGGPSAPYAPGSPTFAAFAQSILAYVQALSAGTQPGALPAPVVIDYSMSTLMSATPPYMIGVTLGIARTQFVDPVAVKLLPSIGSVTTTVPVTMPSGGITALAAAFETQFTTLKLATGASQFQRGELWAVDVGLVTLSIGQSVTNPTYFAPAPLYNTLQSGTVNVPSWSFSGQPPYTPTDFPYTYHDIDIDTLAQQMFAAIDSLLAGPFAAAAYTVSTAVGSDDYTQLVTLRGQMAQRYGANQIQWLFDEQAPLHPQPTDPSLWAARASFSDDLRGSLANAYAIDAVVQYPATCTSPASNATSGISLSGTVQSTTGASPTFPSTAVKLRLPSSSAFLGEGLLSVNYRPTAAANTRSVEYPLQYQVTNIAFGDDPTNPSAEPTWLLFPLPVTAPIGNPQTTTIPIVVRQFPTPPALMRQYYTPFAQPNDPTFTDQLSWDYGYRMQVTPNAADTITTTVRFNVSSAPKAGLLGAGALSLADATVRFQQGYLSLSPELDVVIQAASSTDQTVVAKAAAVLDGLVDLISGVVNNSTWTTSGLMLGSRFLATGISPRIDKYTVDLSAVSTGSSQWQMVVSVAPDATGDLASLVPTPLTMAGDPQPNTSQPVYTPTSITVTYTPADPNAPLIVQIGINKLLVLTLQSAWSSVSLARNADLMTGFTTENAFVYQTPDTAFPDLVTPFLEGPATGFDIAQLTGMSSGTLANYLTALLQVMFVPGGTAPNNTPLISASIGYARPVFTGLQSGTPQPSAAVFPLVLSATEMLACTGAPAGEQIALPAFASALASGVTQWTHANPIDTTEGYLVVSFTIYANSGGAATALATLPNLTLALSHVTDARAS